MPQGKKIIVGITGSIAAYKTVFLVRELVKQGAEVKVILTPAARDFVSPLTLATLSRNPVLSGLFDEQGWSNHVMLGRWADVFLVAPLSCNTMAKMAQGACDNLLLAVYLSATCPVVLAPAMDEDMWQHPSTRANLARLGSFGHKIIPVGSGDLASGLTGEGRMAEPAQIIDYLRQYIFKQGPLQGKKALVTAGPTYEPIDPVRFIGNHSSGKMGIAIAEELQRRGASVTLVLGPSGTDILLPGVETIRVQTAAEMYKACQERFPASDIGVMAAAVADYTPVVTADRKIKKTVGSFSIDLKKTTDILKSLGETKRDNQVLLGFALETDNEKMNAREKLEKKNADLIVLNSLKDPGAGFGKDTNKITIFTRDGREFPFETKSKKEVAADIVDTLIRLHYA
ncbi:MAG: bifunctional phosphopantothenoylcysteine decarboxylase/phosphopantothenate--cysteine ligase CoaBC [Sphingobacteriales bacterium]|nr:bifunctional phosphopantothenoylcysteine decarboxylase/phosphopantothenate--cysteine ligase CoaBC [Sphingobacteriales bacterium]